MNLIFDYLRRSPPSEWLCLAILAVIVAVGISVHVLACAADGDWGYLITGTVMFPIGVTRGIAILLGF